MDLQQKPQTPQKERERSLRRMRFTWFNYTEDDIKRIQQLPADACDYICYGHELCPDTGKPHLQGYVEFRCGTTFKQAQKRLLGRTPKKGTSPLRTLPANASRDKNIEYCKKAESADPAYPVKFFELVHNLRNQGRREAAMLFHDVVDTIDDGAELTDVIRIFPDLFIKHTTGMNAVFDILSNDKHIQNKKNEFLNWKPFIWQQKLINELIYNEPDKRSIIWYSDSHGNSGKSELVDWLALFHDAEWYENCKTADIAHAWKGKKICMFDFTKSLEGHINYAVIEAIKNGRIFSPKYNSKQKMFSRPHVVVFANYPPDMSKLIADRWDIRSIKREECVHPDLASNSLDSGHVIEDLTDPVCPSLDDAEITPGAIKELADNIADDIIFEDLTLTEDGYINKKINKVLIDDYIRIGDVTPDDFDWQTMSFASQQNARILLSQNSTICKIHHVMNCDWCGHLTKDGYLNI